MPDVTKHVLSQSSLLSDVKAFFSIAQTRRTIVFTYGFTFTFVVFTIFIAFNPDISLSPWLRNTFTTKNSTSYQTQFSSFFSYFFSNYNSVVPEGKDLNNTTTLNVSSQSSQGTKITGRNQSSLSNSTSSMLIRNGFVAEQRNGTIMGSAKLSLKNCNLFEGRWVKDDSYPLYPDGSCSPIDEKFNCIRNGRPDRDYQKLRWQPNGCNIPRLNATDMLEMLRGRRLAFAGDSLNRNMWESLVCILKSSVNNKSKVFEASGRHEFQTENSYSFVFEDYNCSVEFFWSPFLVQEWKISEPNGTTKETLRLDMIEQSASKYRDADIVVFNTGHWWTHEKTSQGKDYYQEGSHVYEELNVLEAFRRALTTWGGWVDANIHPNKSLVFFRGYSATHFSGGRWNSGGQCNSETEPIRNETYLDPYPDKMRVFETVMKGMKTPINYLNITRLTDYRKDGHPSVYRKKNQTQEERSSALRLQDCSHWCLPGVPDAWNELLYAMLLIQR